VTKHNERNPGKEVLFMNYAAVDPDLTNSKCSSGTSGSMPISDMKMEALTSFMAEKKESRRSTSSTGLRVRPQVRRAAKEYWHAAAGHPDRWR